MSALVIRNCQIGFQVVLDRQKGSCISILVKGGRQKGPHIFALNKRNRQMGFQVDGDRQKGSRISLFEGRQMGLQVD